MFNIVLYQPEIPPNTGNIIRLCANSGAHLHLIHPLGFIWDDKRIRRAGLDYHHLSCVTHHIDWASYLAAFPESRIFALTTKATTSYSKPTFKPGDTLLFGAETCGLPPEVLENIPAPQRLRIPMQQDSRSINLSNAVSIVLYEAWRQQEFAGSG